MPAQTQAEYYFEKWSSDPKAAHAFISSQIDDPTTDLVESSWLDYKDGSSLWFKNKMPVSLDERRGEIMRQLGEYISAFGNTSGGLLIWGILSPNRIPVKSSYCQDVGAHVAICESLFREATDPPVSGVRFLAIPNPGKKPKGYVVALIPKSEHGPHRSNVKPERTFWMRTSDSCDPIPTGMLRTMFYPKIEPYCKLEATCTILDGGSEGYIRPSIAFRIVNIGNASAERPVIALNQMIWGYSAEFHSLTGWTFSNNERVFRSPETIHPGLRSDVGSFFSRVPVELKQFRKIPSAFELTIFSRDSRPLHWKGILINEDLKMIPARLGRTNLVLNFCIEVQE